MSIIGLDPQANGWRDDGTESGVIRTDPASGGVVSVPFVQGQYGLEATGSTASFQTGIYYNPDGSSSGFNISVPAGNNGVRIYQPFRGPTFGIRHSSAASSPVITVSVDGDPVAVDTSLPWNAIGGVPWVTTLYNGFKVTHRDLDPGEHVAEIVINAPETGANAVTLFGYIADRSAGYTDLPVLSQLVEGGAVPTSFAYPEYGPSGQQLAAISRIFYANTTADEITVTVRRGSGGTIGKLAVPANGTAAFDLGAPVANGRLIMHQASASGLTHVTMGVF